MTLAKHLAVAANQLEGARSRLLHLRDAPNTSANVRRWLIALTDHALALSEVQQYADEAILEQLRAVGQRSPSVPESVEAEPPNS